MIITNIHIIYIPGLGDGYDGLRSAALKRWRRKNITVTFVPMKWRTSEETYEQKMQRIDEIISSKKSDGRIVLIGESAGGAMALSVFANSGESITKVITICGKNVRSDRVSPYVYKNNPAFRLAMRKSEEFANTITHESASKITTFYSPTDPTVRYIDTFINGARIEVLRTPGHIISIMIVLFFTWPRIVKEAVKP